MILLCDEDVGTGVPNALHAVNLQAHSIVSAGLIGAPDTRWLEVAGDRNWLVVSRNKRMLRVEDERMAIVANRVGIVYFTDGDMSPAAMLRLLLNKWNALEVLDRDLPRPFARFLSPNGRISASHRGLRL